MQITELIKELTAVHGTSGNEYPAAKCAERLLRPFCKRIETDRLGNLIAVVREPKENRPHVLLDAHIDQIGLVVTYIEENGFLRVAASGGVDIRLLCAAEVIVHGREDLFGVICTIPPHLQKGEAKNLKCDDVYIDTGYTKEQLDGRVALGDTVTFRSAFTELMGSTVKSGALDDRAGCAALIRAVQLTADEELSCGVTVLLSTREELGCQGSKTGSFAVSPTHAVAVDVSFGYTPDAPKEKCGTLGAGPMIGISPVLDRSIFEELKTLSEREGIPYQNEVMGGTTSTNADSIAVCRAGVKTGLLSIPLKYMHTPVEVIDTRDVEHTAQLIAAYLKEVGRRG
ncbi:M28 family peptidase [Candidatus Soleaferrea massiliensis]|uniref:M28 family peptidase n=1 Tax=Candidatus Soleaferrea massiliensis TaxID=1470354 RepID=UPI00058DC4C9|nr:M28 family peptidase [Candidatus Soleaferrea massiliensis]